MLAETRQRGYATEYGEVTPGFASVAAPVLDHNGHPVAGIAVTFEAPGTDPDSSPAAVRRAADALTTRLGGQPPTAVAVPTLPRWGFETAPRAFQPTFRWSRRLPGDRLETTGCRPRPHAGRVCRARPE